MNEKITCNGCDHTWTAPGAAHCTGCHTHPFSGIALFDRHRTTTGEHGACLDPAAIRTPAGEPVMSLRDGMWRGPEMTDAQKLARFGTRTA